MIRYELNTNNKTRINHELNELNTNQDTNKTQIKKFILIYIFILLFSFSFAFTHTEDAELNQEIQKGKEIVEKFYRGEIKCQNLTNEDFHSVGEYVMEQMVGGSDHITMNKMIEQMHGKQGEELMHINMGKRFLGCDGGGNWMMPMMDGGMPMMGYWGFWNWRGWNFLALIFGIVGVLWLLVILSFPILVLILLILGIIYLIKKLKSEIKKE
jgi:uncharacterized membrane protein